VKICDPFRAAGFFFLVAERHFELTCTCGVRQRADVLPTRIAGKVTLYDCPSCGTSLVGVAKDDQAPVTDGAGQEYVDGHRMCGFVFGSMVDMELWPPAALESYMAIPARPAFFSARGCAQTARES